MKLKNSLINLFKSHKIGFQRPLLFVGQYRTEDSFHFCFLYCIPELCLLPSAQQLSILYLCWTMQVITNAASCMHHPPEEWDTGILWLIIDFYHEVSSCLVMELWPGCLSKLIELYLPFIYAANKKLNCTAIKWVRIFDRLMIWPSAPNAFYADIGGASLSSLAQPSMLISVGVIANLGYK